MKLPKHMKISELSKASSTPATSIRFYIKEGLLPEPIKTSKTMAYYTRDHLDRLRFIEKIKKEENLPLSKIRELIQSEFPAFSIPEDKRVYSNRREEIIEVAIELFREKGYSETDLLEAGLLTKTEKHSHAVAHCQRCSTTVEPYLSRQWFVKVKPLSEPALAAVINGDIKMHPEKRIKV